MSVRPRMVQEGDVINLPNEGTLPTVAGDVAVSSGFIGMWNDSGKAPGSLCPMIVAGVVRVKNLAGGAEGIEIGTEIALDTDLNVLGVYDDENEDHVLLGRAIQSVPANGTRSISVRIKAQ